MYADGRVRRGRPARAVCLAVLGLVCASSSLAADRSGFPERPLSTRQQAERVLASGDLALADSLSVRIARALAPEAGSPASWTEAARLLSVERRDVDGTEQTILSDGSTVVSLLPATPDDRIRRGFDLADAVATIERARSETATLLGDVLAMDRFEPVDIVLAPIGADVEGYAVPAAANGTPVRIVLDPRGLAGSGSLLRAASREIAFAALSVGHPAVEPGWIDAIARWAAFRVAGTDEATLALFEERRDRFREGLATTDPALAPGNALWFAWLDEAIGGHAIRVSLEELGRTSALDEALDPIAARAAGTTGASLLREFQLWCVLTGALDDGRHLSFAGRLRDPSFAAAIDWLPAISVQSDEPIAPLGGSAFRIAPDGDVGGMGIRFEGGFEARWSADVLLRLADGATHRVPIRLDAGRGEVTVPLAGLDEVILLVRNDGSDTGGASRFTWAAIPVRGFPLELSRLEARWVDGAARGIVVDWETASEHRLLGFDIVRTPAEGGLTRRVNPVWIPAIGDAAKPAAYRFLDPTAEAGRAYLYRIEGITLEGLRSPTRPVLVTVPDADR